MDRDKIATGGRPVLEAPIKAAVAIGTGTAALMLGYEAFKEQALPLLTKWESHIATVAMAGLFAGVAGYLASRRFREVNDRLRAENAVRIEAEKAAKEALDGKAVLLRELQHRAKNSFAMISSLISLSEGESDSPEAIALLSETGARVSAIAELYGMLYASGSVEEVELGEYLERVIGIIADRPGIALRCELGRGAIPAEDAIRLGLIATELATNSIKHAFPNGRGGEITASSRFGADGLYFAYSDDGIGMPTGVALERPSSLGLTLIRSLTEQMGGAGKLGEAGDFDAGGPTGLSARKDRGTTWLFRFPGIARRTESDGEPRPAGERPIE